ncbi:MAG TPA: GNAT family N-acetyltransferase [Candidatus Saccharimonadales bacterium]|nr:GNAT family N-acetyltransferase [Candidatus Saccharimonadales bacterium]
MTSRLPETLAVPDSYRDGIFLEALTGSDHGDLEGFLAANRSHLARFASFSGAGISEEAARLVGSVGGGDELYKIMHRGDAQSADIGGLVGLSGLGTGKPTAQLSYCIAERLQGRGFVTAAARTLCAVAFRERPIQQIVAGIALENVQSERVMIKLGGSCEGVWGFSYQTNTYVRRWGVSREVFIYK